ncbi:MULTISPECIES: MDR family MFS transporter [Streptomyces]|uniref:MDR family MFS transporter n=1 Tax=Streptomyces TaxID=1883 RepID=UPI0025AF7B9C|nr:MDR family MFS transporter [Streptomyces sp. SRF1]MDN3055923.1 MDR family MFS transporter [Streptomyces sp. SRF1]
MTSPSTGASPSAPEQSASDRLDPTLIRLGVILVIGAIASMLDTTIVSVAIDGLSREFDTDISTIQWASTGYLLALSAVIPLTGWAVERFGARTMWLFSLTAFLAGSALCGAAWSVGSLIAFRVLQGIGGGMITPVMQTILVRAAGPQRIGRIMSIVAVPGHLSPIVGPLVGGAIIDSVSWRWIFYVNVPICAIALLLAWRGVPRDTRNDTAARLDVLGLALLSPGLAAIIYGLSQTSRPEGFGATPVVVSLALGAVLLAAFAAHALRTRITPVLDLRLFRHRSFTAATLLMFLGGMSVFGAMLLMPLYYQQVRDKSALDAGLLLAPQSIGTIIALTYVGKLTDRIGSRPIVLTGVAIGVAGTLAYTQVQPDTSVWLLSASLLIWGIGIAASMVPIMSAAYQGLEPAAIPRATSAISVIQRLGGSFGTAVLSVILQRQIIRHADGGEADPDSLTKAFDTTFWWVLGFTALTLVPALLLPQVKKRKPAEPAPEPATAKR